MRYFIKTMYKFSALNFSSFPIEIHPPQNYLVSLLLPKKAFLILYLLRIFTVCDLRLWNSAWTDSITFPTGLAIPAAIPAV